MSSLSKPLLESIPASVVIIDSEGEVIECDMFGLAATTSDMQEGMGAFLEKRPANFEGK